MIALVFPINYGVIGMVWSQSGDITIVADSCTILTNGGPIVLGF